MIAIEGYIYKGAEENVPHSNNCFELLSFDIILDKKADPWLLSTKKNPNDVPDCVLADVFILIGIVPKEKRVDQNRR